MVVAPLLCSLLSHGRVCKFLAPPQKKKLLLALKRPLKKHYWALFFDDLIFIDEEIRLFY
jgi:hypothetical protein